MGDDFEKIIGQVIGQGAQATIYAQGEYAVKLYREGYPKANVFSEGYIMANLERDNFPSPKVYEILLINGRYGLRMERVQGKMMMEDLTDPAKARGIIDVLADLQYRLQNYDNVNLDWAPDIKVRLRNDLMRNDRLSAGIKQELQEKLARLPDGQALCHCDFHAGNIFSDGKKYTIIDLLQISKGEPAADAACSYVAYSFMDRELAEYYLERYCQVSGIPRKKVEEWLRVYVGTLLGQVPEELTPVIEDFLNRP